jgi:hypothetical protein
VNGFLKNNFVTHELFAGQHCFHPVSQPVGIIHRVLSHPMPDEIAVHPLGAVNELFHRSFQFPRLILPITEQLDE